ncbi:MAG: transporter [Candidatus Omnitrophica bacterium]|nr:transporter [Candidatus Omnitrophota bacterium]
MKFIFWGMMMGVAILAASVAFAGEENTEEGWSPYSAGPITAWTAPLVGKGKLAVQPIVSYSRTRGSFDNKGHQDSLPDGEKKSQASQQIFTQYGITDEWEVALQMIYQENFRIQNDEKAHDQGFGDSYLFTRYEFLEEKSWMPEATALVQLKMPTGKYEGLDPDMLETDAMGTGSWDPGVGINLTKTFKPFMIHADLVASFPQTVRVDGVKTRYGNYLNYDLAVEYFLLKGFNLMMEVNGVSQGDTREDGEGIEDSHSRSLTLAPGIGWSNERIQTLVAYQRTILGTNADVNDAVVATFIYTF